jgi:hypothetical protein
VHTMRMAILVSWCVVTSIYAAHAQWIETYAQGGTISSFAANGSNFVLGTSSGVFRSSNNGLSWGAANNGLQSLNVTSLVRSGTTFIAGVTVGTNGGSQYYDGGVFVSSDNGASWTAHNTGFAPNRQVQAVCPIGTTLFASVYPQGLFRSGDNGQTWTSVDSGLTNSYVYAIIGVGSVVLVGTRGGGVFRSTDNGDTWTVADSGIIPDSFDGIRAQNFTVIGSRVFVGTGYHFYVSSDSGLVWTQLSAYPTGFLLSLAVRDTTIFEASEDGFYRSTDYGVTWTLLSGPGSYFGTQTPLMVAVSGPSLFVGTDRGLFYRANAGDTSWTNIVYDLPGGPCMVTVVATAGTGLIAGTQNEGTFFSADSGTTWTPYNGLPPYVSSIAVRGTDICAGTSSGVFASTNNGAAWTRTNTGLTDTGVNCVAALGTNFFAGTLTAGVFRSTNNGENWTTAGAGLTNLDVQHLAASGTDLFAATFGGGLFRSSDNGTSWISISSSLADTTVYALLSSGPMLYAGTWSGVFRSDNVGKTWSLMDTSGLRNTHVSALAVNGSTLYAGTSLYLVGPYRNPTAVPGGVFFSSTGGGPWTEAPDSSGTLRSISCLTVSGTNLLAGTAGVWRRPLSEMVTSVGESHSVAPAAFSLEQNYPNPFNPTTSISYALSRQSQVSLEVFDILGRKVATLVNKQESAGRYRVTFDGAYLASGLYFYRLRAGENMTTKKMLLVR